VTPAEIQNARVAFQQAPVSQPRRDARRGGFEQIRAPQRIERDARFRRDLRCAVEHRRPVLRPLGTSGRALRHRGKDRAHGRGGRRRRAPQPQERAEALASPAARREPRRRHREGALELLRAETGGEDLHQRAFAGSRPCAHSSSGRRNAEACGRQMESNVGHHGTRRSTRVRLGRSLAPQRYL
jgi:hypothetical protein